MKIPNPFSNINLINRKFKIRSHILNIPSSIPQLRKRNLIETQSIAQNALAQYKIISKAQSGIVTDIANTHVGEDKQKIIPNFATQHRRKEKDFPKTYYNSDDEDALLEKQEAVYRENKATHPFYKDFITDLNTYLQGYNISHISEKFSQRITEFSVPLDKQKKLFRGVALPQQELEQIEITLAYDHIPSIKFMTYCLLHPSNCDNKITSVSTLPKIAEIFAFQTAQTLKQSDILSKKSYFPICIILKCDENAPPPKGLTFPVNKLPSNIPWIKDKNEHEIILDGENNQYQMTNIDYDTQKKYHKITVKMRGVE